MLKLLFVLSIVTASIKDEGCRVACLRSGFDTGKYSKNGCDFVSRFDFYEDFIAGRIHLGLMNGHAIIEKPFKSVYRDYD